VNVCSKALVPQAVSILIWDQDDLCTVHTAAEAIEEYQSVVIPCSSRAGILFTLEHKTVDVVILNLQKPLQDTFQLLSEIQGKAPQVEVIFVSPFDDDETRWAWTETIGRGAYEFLPKPLDPSELNRVLVQATEKHHPIQLRKRPPAESVRHLTAKARKAKASSQN
jgi:two-component system, OmpR family, phosphate regulon sensor histidine kinase PhoR